MDTESCRPRVRPVKTYSGWLSKRVHLENRDAVAIGNINLIRMES